MGKDIIKNARIEKSELSEFYVIDIAIYKDGSFVCNMLDELAPSENLLRIELINTGVRKP